MQAKLPPINMKIVKNLVIVANMLVFGSSVAFCADLGHKQQAQEYRQRGLEAQKIGDLDTAVIYYQKAIEIAPYFISAYNDLGIAYELKGWLDRAEDIYLRGLQVDPSYLNIYSNLALLYERKKDFQKAALYWKKRRDLGDPNEAWTQKAQERLDALSDILPEIKKELLEKRAAELSKDVILDKRQEELAKINQAKEHFEIGFVYFQKEQYAAAIEEFKKSLEMAPQDLKTKELLSKAQKFDTENQIKFLSEQGLKFYQQDDIYSAIQEFNKILSLVSKTVQYESK